MIRTAAARISGPVKAITPMQPLRELRLSRKSGSRLERRDEFATNCVKQP
jgi:hypothetical protein